MSASCHSLIPGFVTEEEQSQHLLSPAGMQFGLGRHHEAIDMDSQELVYHSLQHLIIVETLWSTTVTFVKISILSFYWRLFNMSSIRLPIRLLGVLTMLWLIARVRQRNPPPHPPPLGCGQGPG